MFTLRDRLLTSTAVYAPEGAAAQQLPQGDEGGQSHDQWNFNQEEDASIDSVIDRGEMEDDSSKTQDAGEGAQGDQAGQAETPQGKQDAGQGTDRNKQGEQEQTQQQRTPGPQGLVLNDGTVIKGGPERRLYEKSQRLEGQLTQTQQDKQRVESELQQARAQVQAYEQATSSAREHGLSPQEVTLGNRIIAAYKNDPVKTINYLLTEAKAAGHDVTAIGGGGVDTAAIQRIIENQLKPFTEQHRAAEEQQRRDAQAEQEAQQFFQRFPDAVTHENEIAQLLERDPSMSPDAAYYALQSYFARNGFRWDIPLAQQFQSAQQPNGNAQPQQPQQAQPQQAAHPLPNGRGGGAGVTPQTNTRQPYDPKHASEDASWEDIISSSMRDAGM